MTIPANGATAHAAAASGVRGAIESLEEVISRVRDVADYIPSTFAEIKRELERLHARLRAQEAANYLGEPLRKFQSHQSHAPWMMETTDRLRQELTSQIGILDRLMRQAESVIDQPLEEQEIFVLRVRELLAAKRRHLAEEDRIIAQAWQDVGGNG